MMNYVKSENYRLLRKEGLYMTSAICLLLIAAAAIVLYISPKSDPTFPYATTSFFYSNVIAGGAPILIVAFLFNLLLTGKDASLMKQSIQFGISRNTIFWSKLLLTLSYFLVICVIGLLLTIGLGESLLDSEELSIRNFLTASFNMLPFVLSGFFLVHTLKMLKMGDVYIVILLLFIYLFSGDLLRMLFRSMSSFDSFYKYAPSTLLDENLMDFMDQSVQLDYRCWMVGIVISVISLWIGSKRFQKQNID